MSLATSALLIVAIVCPTQPLQAVELQRLNPACDPDDLVCQRNLGNSSSGSSSSSSSSGGGSSSSSSSSGGGNPSSFNSGLNAGSSCNAICSANGRWETYMRSDARCMANTECKSCVEQAISSSILKGHCGAVGQASKGKTFQIILISLFTAVSLYCLAGCVPLFGLAVEGSCQIAGYAVSGIDLLSSLFMGNDFLQQFATTLPTIATTILTAQNGAAIASGQAAATKAAAKAACLASAMYGSMAILKGLAYRKMSDSETQSCTDIETMYGTSGGFGSSVNDCLALAGLNRNSSSAPNYNGNATACTNPYDPTCVPNNNNNNEPQNNMYGGNDWINKDWNKFIEDSFSDKALLVDSGLDKYPPQVLNALKETALSAPKNGIDVNKIRAMAASGASVQQIMDAGVRTQNESGKAAFMQAMAGVEESLKEMQKRTPGTSQGSNQGSAGQMSTGGGAAALSAGAAPAEADLDVNALLEKMLGGGEKKEEQNMGVNGIGFGGRKPASTDIFHSNSKESIFKIVSRKIEQKSDSVEKLEPALPMNKALSR